MIAMAMGAEEKPWYGGREGEKVGATKCVCVCVCGGGGVGEGKE